MSLSSSNDMNGTDGVSMESASRGLQTFDARGPWTLIGRPSGSSNSSSDTPQCCGSNPRWTVPAAGDVNVVESSRDLPLNSDKGNAFKSFPAEQFSVVL